jgi:cob(I)alamin adenosyltransferase
MLKVILALFIVSFLIVGCTPSSVVTTVVQKAYSLTTTAQVIVNNASPESFAKMAVTIDASLGFISTALNYISPKITNPTIVAAIAKVQASIVTVQAALKTLTPETLVQTKAIVVSTLDNIKSTIATIASYFDIPLPVTSANVTVSADPIKDLQKAMDDLNKALPKK